MGILISLFLYETEMLLPLTERYGDVVRCMREREIAGPFIRATLETLDAYFNMQAQQQAARLGKIDYPNIIEIGEGKPWRDVKWTYSMLRVPTAKVKIFTISGYPTNMVLLTLPQKRK